MSGETLTVPGVYIKEINALSMSIHSGETAVPVFIGYFNNDKGELYPDSACIRIESWLEFTTKFGSPNDAVTVTLEDGNSKSLKIGHTSHLGSYSVRLYFENGGGPCYVLPLVDPDNPLLDTLVAKIEQCPDISLLCWCGYTKKDKEVYAALAQLLDKRYFLLADVIQKKANGNGPVNALRLQDLEPKDSAHMAAYFPALQTSYRYKSSDEMITVNGLKSEDWGNETKPLTLSAMVGISAEKITECKKRLTDAKKNKSEDEAAINEAQVAFDKAKKAKGEDEAAIKDALDALEKVKAAETKDETAINEAQVAFDKAKKAKGEDEAAIKDALAALEKVKTAAGQDEAAIKGALAALEKVKTVAGQDETAIKDALAALKKVKTAKAKDEIAIKDALTALEKVKTAAGQDPITGAQEALEEAKRVNNEKDEAAINKAQLALDACKENDGLCNRIRQAVTSQPIYLRASCAMAGVIARTDRERGVWKAPANVALSGVEGLVSGDIDGEISPLRVDDALNETLVNARVNAIREFKGKGFLVWGARTAVDPSQPNWLYIPVRRLFNAVERDIGEALRVAMFEPNSEPTWERVRSTIDIYLHGLWCKGALMGNAPEEAYFVHIGLGVTMIDTDIKQGRMIVKVGMAAVRPVEFIELQFTQDMVS